MPASRSRSRSAALLTWYDRHGRDLPWRRTVAPYPVWISEIMLQQTTVETVIPYWQRFIAALPDVAALAAATEDRVLTLWAGLGYYRRARSLHAAARHIVEQCSGAFPDTLEGLRELPGVGAYTAAAIGSICFGIPEPVIDGNVIRVAGRYLALEQDPRRGEGRGRIEALARELLDPARPGDFNQALMELGATLCRPKAPRCGPCPLASGCQGHARGKPEAYPPPPSRPATVEIGRHGVVIEDSRDRRLLRRIPAGRHNQGLWEIPWIGDDAPSERSGNRMRRRFEQVVGFSLKGLSEPLLEIHHVITRHRIRLRVSRAQPAQTPPGSRRGWRWQPATRVGELALTAATRKVLEQLSSGK